MDHIELLRAQLKDADPRGRADLLIALLQNEGQQHFEENVTQYAHAVQTAYLAKKSGADPELIAAALLHDIGHLLVEGNFSENTYNEEDHFHEIIAADFLAPYFPPSVTLPIKMHVLAKRYLVSKRPGYFEKLSEASQESFRLQGGTMSEEEMTHFEAMPYHQEAVALRIWDDLAKDEDAQVPPAEAYKAELIAAMR